MKKAIAAIALTPLLLGTQSCRHEQKTEAEGVDMLVQIGDSALTLPMVIDQIPTGLSAADSTALFNAIVDDWVRGMLLSEVAMRNVADSEKIEKLVEEYRNTLIINEYRRQMQSAGKLTVSEDAIRAYYLRNSAEMRLDRPLIKGIYIKIPADSEHKDQVRKWVRSGSRDDIDKLEKYGLREAMQYDWFGDRWIDWNTVAGQIPFRFGDPDEFVRTHRNFETEANGSAYLLHIDSYLKSGEPIPYDFARDRISEILIAENSADYDRRLLRALYDRALKEGTVKPGSFDPATHKRIINKNPDKQ